MDLDGFSQEDVDDLRRAFAERDRAERANAYLDGREPAAPKHEHEWEVGGGVKYRVAPSGSGRTWEAQRMLPVDFYGPGYPNTEIWQPLGAQFSALASEIARLRGLTPPEGE